MKLQENTLAVLKNFALINPSLLVKKGNQLRTISGTGNIFSVANIDDQFDSEFCIYDLDQFLSVLSLFQEPQLDFSDTYVTISDGGSKKIKYTYADSDLIDTPPDKDIEMPQADISFKLDEELYVDFIKAASVLNLPELCIKGENGDLKLTVVDSNNPSTNSYSVVIGKCENDCEIYFKIENFKMLRDDYDVEISNQNIAKFSGSITTYFVAAEMNSNYG